MVVAVFVSPLRWIHGELTTMRMAYTHETRSADWQVVTDSDQPALADLYLLLLVDQMINRLVS